MKTIRLNLYGFNELSEQSKDHALEKLRDYNLFYDWYNFNYEDFVELSKTIGITVDPKNIHFRGFYSQGDGSAFEASVDLVKLINGIKAEEWKSYAPKMKLGLSVPHIDKRILGLIERDRLDLISSINSKGRYYYVSAAVDFYQPSNGHDYSNIAAELEILEKWLQDIAEELNDHLFKSLRDNYEYLTGDEALIEAFEANELLFTEDGKPASRIINLSEDEEQ